jgi:hypothetical protein
MSTDIPTSDGLVVGDIDYSPSPFAKKISFVLNESNLQGASQSQLERFWRVWYTDRHLYAPYLESFTLFLRASYDDTTGAYVTNGINTFMEYFRDQVEPHATKREHIAIFMDTDTETCDMQCHAWTDVPIKLLEVQVLRPVVVAPSHPMYCPVVLSPCV